MKARTLRLSDDLNDALEALAAANRRSWNSEVVLLVEAALGARGDLSVNPGSLFKDPEETRTQSPRAPSVRTDFKKPPAAKKGRRR